MNQNCKQTHAHTPTLTRGFAHAPKYTIHNPTRAHAYNTYAHSRLHDYMVEKIIVLEFLHDYMEKIIVLEFLHDYMEKIIVLEFLHDYMEKIIVLEFYGTSKQCNRKTRKMLCFLTER